jgi:hypothetical protein
MTPAVPPLHHTVISSALRVTSKSLAADAVALIFLRLLEDKLIGDHF